MIILIATACTKGLALGNFCRHLSATPSGGNTVDICVCMHVLTIADTDKCDFSMYGWGVTYVASLTL